MSILNGLTCSVKLNDDIIPSEFLQIGLTSRSRSTKRNYLFGARVIYAPTKTKIPSLYFVVFSRSFPIESGIVVGILGN